MTFYLKLENFPLELFSEKDTSKYGQFKALTDSIIDVFDDCEPLFAVAVLLDHFHGVADYMWGLKS